MTGSKKTDVLSGGCGFLLLLSFVLLPSVAVCQTTVVMPHMGVDTLYVSSTGCYRIVDPGGEGKYANNEDSYLYIIATEPFWLRCDYELGHTNDGKDWLRVYQDTVDWYGSEYMDGSGSRECHLWSSRALVHFHSNGYNTFDGFELLVEQVSSIGGMSYEPLGGGSVRLEWEDWRGDASEWTVYYTRDDDTLLEATTGVKSVTLSGLEEGCFYRYYVVDDVVGCTHKEYGWFGAGGDSSLLVMEPGVWDGGVQASGVCYSLRGPTGDTASMDLDWMSTEYGFNDGHGVYLRGVYRTLNGEVGVQRRTPWGDSWSEYLGSWNRTTEQEYWGWFPEGWVYAYVNGRSRYAFDVLPENDSYVTPTVTGVGATWATIAWSDASGSTTWRVRYEREEGRWAEVNTTVPSVTLGGLEPGRQYVYTIEGNVKRSDCDVAARHGLVTTGLADTIVMPYRGEAVVTLEPRRCYTIMDAGKEGGYFNTDFSKLVVRTANGKGFRVEGRCVLEGDDRLMVDNGRQRFEYNNNNYDIQVSSAGDSMVIYFQSDVQNTSDGFELRVLQVDDSIGELRTVAVGTTAATIAWSDASGATQWTVHYGPSEESFQTLTTTMTQATLGGLLPGVQYVYYVTNGASEGGCLFSDRRAFITQGLPAGEVLMPYRGRDTLVLQAGTCYRIWDAGGAGHNYFNSDTSVLVIMSSDGGDFVLDGQWLFGGNEAEYGRNSYDTYDRLSYQQYDNEESYWNECDGWYNRFAGNDRMRFESRGGYLRLRFTSDNRRTRPGFCLTVDREPGGVEGVRLVRVTSTSATVTWRDDSGASGWTVAYGAVGSATTTTVSTSTRSCTLTGLAPNTDYAVRVYAGGVTPCDVPQSLFTTLGSGAIVMTPHGDDTVYIAPGQCYYVYDPGGTGDYVASDTSRLVIRSTTGEGFYYYASATVGNADRSDNLYVSDATNGTVWWDWERWEESGEMTIELRSNEAIQDRGFWMWVRFPSMVFGPDTTGLTDTTVTITWQDTSSATQWNFSYGSHIDSMTTVTTSVRQYTLTGLERNRQYFYSIYNTTEDQSCVLENIYGVVMPTDDGVYVDPYRNYYLNRCGRGTPYMAYDATLPAEGCYRFMDVGGEGELFYNSDNNFTLHSQNSQGLTLEGRYDLGSSSIWISDGISGSWYSGIGYLNLYSPTGSLNFQQRTGSSKADYARGFDLGVSFNYKIYNVRAQNVGCTSATLRWDDSTSATQWTLAYGATERELDTLVVGTKSVLLENLLADHQYVCYITSNDSTLLCQKPVKYCFVTTCDTTIFVLPYNRDTTRVLDIEECYTIRDGGSTKDYLYNDRHTVVLKSSSGGAVTLRGWADFGENDYLYITDQVDGTWLWGGGRQEEIEVTARSGQVRLEYSSAGDTMTGRGFEFRATFHTISNINVSLKTDTTCRLTWDDNSGATQWVCHYGRDRKGPMDSVVCSQRVAHLENLVYGKRYYVYFTNNSVACIDTTWFEFCAGGDKCVDFGDIYSCFATSYYGRFNNPQEYRGMVDYGPDDINSRQTVIDDTLATDPRTGNQLRCVCPGFPESVRLGNWDIGGEAESITYEYDVDTTKSEILLLRYAAVLENPNHSPSMQPRFRLSLVDEVGNDIDPDCYAADFVSSDSLGWNLYRYDTNTVLWKDWTAIGIDLAPLHGRRVYFKLTTYDCAEMGHFGYAYFTLECTEKEIAPNVCGVVSSNTFTAPEGFRYEWYNVDSTDVILSTARTFSSSQNGIYKCRAHFIGSTGSNCYFEKTAVVGDIFPYANYSYEIIDTNGCDVVVQFYNQSCVTLDAAHTQPTTMECDGFVWNFGDGTTSTDKHPVHQFPSREFDVSLYATLANGACSDDTVQTILMRSPCIAYDTVYPEICGGDTFALRDSVYTTTGFYTVRTEYRPDSIVTTFVHLTVHPTLDTNINGGICDGRSFTYFGFNDSVAGDYVHAFTSIYGCDSIYRLHLQVAQSYELTVDRYGCSSSGYHYRDTVFASSTVYTDSLLSVFLCDSVVTMNITINSSYLQEFYDTICSGQTVFFAGNYYTSTGTYVDSAFSVDGCDSVSIEHLKVNPVYQNNSTEYICMNQTYTYRGNQYGEGLIVDSLLTVDRCDSVIRITVEYYDIDFRADGLLSIDSIAWTQSDSALYQCQPLTLYTKDLSVSYNSILWLFGDGSSSPEANAVHTYADSGIYAVTLIATSPDGCLDTARWPSAVQVLPLPLPDFSWEPIRPSNAEPATTFTNLTDPLLDSNTYLWYFYPRGVDDEPPADSSTEVNPLYIWPDDDSQVGTHDVTLIATRHFTTLRGNAHQCVDTVTKNIELVNVYLRFPNVVTPNGDGHNDIWQVVNLVEYNLYPINRLRIYNRWGRLVYQRDNITSHADDWNPNDCDCPDGTYFFRFDAQGNFGFIQHNGAIEVVR